MSASVFHRTVRRSARVLGAAVAVAALVSAVVAPPLVAQDAEGEERVLEIGRWYPELEVGLALTQSAYSDNWRGGDQGALAWTLLSNAVLENQLSPSVNWKNNLKLAFGQTHQQQTNSDGGRYWASPIKSTDLIDFESLARFTLGGFVDPFVGVRLESQFLDATDTEDRDLLFNPVRLRESAGIARQFYNRENRSLQSRFGFTFRQGIRRAFVDPAPEDRTKTETTNDGGFEFVTDSKYVTSDERLAWTSQLILYQPVFYSGRDALVDAGLGAVADYSLALDAEFENVVTAQVTKILSVNLYTRWIYDRYDNSLKPTAAEDGSLTNLAAVRGAVRKGGQFKQTLGIGIVFRVL